MNKSSSNPLKESQIIQKVQMNTHQNYLSSAHQNIRQKSHSNPIMEMEQLTIGQPITKEGMPLMTPLLQVNSNISQNQTYAQSPMNMSRLNLNNNLQMTSPRALQINPNLGQLRFEQFPDSHLPQTLFCFKCNKMVITTVQEDYGLGTYAVGLGLCILFFPCAFIPFMQKQCKDYIHCCRECKTYLGKKVFLCRLC